MQDGFLLRRLDMVHETSRALAMAQMLAARTLRQLDFDDKPHCLFGESR